MYQVVVFLHVLSVLLFMLVHGVSVMVMFVIERQEKPEQVRTLLALRQMVSPGVAVLATLILVTGVIAAFMGNSWQTGWVGASLLIFIAIYVLMTVFGRRYFDRIAKVFNAAQPADLSAQLGRSPRLLLTVVGIGGVGVILWLMLFKPF